MKLIYYITILIGLGLVLLAGCSDAPVARTNCWSAPQVSASTKGTGLGSGLVTDEQVSAADVQPCE